MHSYNSVITILDLEDHGLLAYFLWFISEPKSSFEVTYSVSLLVAQLGAGSIPE